MAPIEEHEGTNENMDDMKLEDMDDDADNIKQPRDQMMGISEQG